MGKIQNDIERKKKNEHFIKAFEYVAQRKNLTQSDLAAAIHSKSAYISVYRNGTRPVPEETINELVCTSATIENGAGQIYKPYLLGLSEYMLLRNVPDEEIIEVELRRGNPDYELLRQKKSPEPQDPGDNEKAAETSMVSLAATLIKETEIIRRTLSEALEDVNKLRDQLSTELSNITAIHADMQIDRDAIRAIRTQLSSLLYSMSSSDYRLPMAAENQNQ